MTLTFGTAPDSWGVWFPDNDRQPGWPRFLDEAAEAGFRYIELGPYGYLPADADRLRAEMSARDLRLIAGTLIANFHDRARRNAAVEEARRIADLAAPLGAKFMVGLADHGGTHDDPRKLDPTQWRNLVDASNEVATVLRDEFDMTFVFHSHADGLVEYAEEVERYLDDTDPEVVQFCLDTGHYEYRDGLSADLLRRRHDRIPYLHLKSINGPIRSHVIADDIAFPQAVPLGVMTEPAEGIVDFVELAAVMDEIGYEGWAVVEHDLYPVENLEVPLPIAKRSREYYEGLGWKTA